MKKLISLALLLSIVKLIIAQDEQLGNLSFNPSLYYSTKQYQPVQDRHKYLIDKGGSIIVTTDTLSLPFIDDFSTNRLPGYKWVENHITDTFYNVVGGCLGPEGIKTTQDFFSSNTAWTYSFDVANQRKDSVAQAPIQFTSFGSNTSNCFASAPQPITYWSSYYTYTFDSSTGRKIDSALVTTDTVNLRYAPVVYFAQGEPGTLWADNYAYVNNTYPINPPTIGVATLDGLNEYGLPYNNTNTSTYGTADYLTSKPINLQNLTGADGIYLSFFYEPQGLGAFPNIDDSLILEFKEVGGIWDSVWAHAGYSSQLSSDSANKQFKQVLIYVPELALQFSYYHPTFQFRFRNKASLFCNCDHWNIDYVRLDKNRFATDINIQDIAFVYPFPTVLKNFTLLPADQFNNPSDLCDTITLTVHNLDSLAFTNPPATNYVKGAAELYPTPVIIATDVLQTFNAGDYTNIEVHPFAEYSIPAGVVDSLVLLSTVSISPNDSRPQNDTLRHTQNFNSVMAYDDGTAETAYWLSGAGLKKFAYEFNLNQPDTLAAFQVQFSQVDENVSNLIFSFKAWSALQLNDMNFDDATTTIFSLDNRKPIYIDSVNGFATYKLDTPIIVSGKIYIGWAQTDARKLQIGYDLNSPLGRQHMFAYKGTTWKPSTLSTDGSPMIRLIFDSNFWGGSSSVINLTTDENKITFFPNPTSGTIYIRSEKSNPLLEVSVTNMMGQRVKYENAVSDQINISELQNGIYLLSARDIQTGKTYHSKIIKTAF